jgi:type I restriction enzyme S subunit
VFRSHVRSGLFRALASITTNNAHLTREKFRASPFPLPPAPEQGRIVAEVERRLSLLLAVEHTVEQNLARCQRLRQSILKRAFEGKLVSQDPADEPASALLRRLRARSRVSSERARSTKRTGSRHRRARP